MPKPATTDTIAAASSVAVFFIGGLFLYLPGRIVAALQDRGRGRIGPTLCAGCCLWVFVVPESRRSARPGRSGVGWKRNGSLSGAKSSREKPAHARSVPRVLPEMMERVGLL
jgi:hypothetical protein